MYLQCSIKPTKHRKIKYTYLKRADDSFSLGAQDFENRRHMIKSVLYHKIKKASR
ncbi:hypothetical protein QSI_2413 [Clostridioides difficile P28]|nr:hypothetical protein QSI_2413 [Clostridioides difficile P28]